MTTEERMMLFPVSRREEFDFDTMIGDKSYATISGIPVRIDRVVRDLTKTTVVAVSGTMTLRGVKVRGVWDMYGNIVRYKTIMSLFVPKSLLTSVDSLFEGTTADVFQLVSVERHDEDTKHI